MKHEAKLIKVRGVRLYVEYKYYPAEPGARGDFGMPMEPDAPAEVEIEMITIGKVNVMPLVEDYIDEVEEALL